MSQTPTKTFRKCKLKNISLLAQQLLGMSKCKQYNILHDWVVLVSWFFKAREMSILPLIVDTLVLSELCVIKRQGGSSFLLVLVNMYPFLRRKVIHSCKVGLLTKDHNLNSYYRKLHYPAGVCHTCCESISPFTHL